MQRNAMQDQRVLPKLHRRVFMSSVGRDELSIYISFYIEAANRDAFMETKQDIFLKFAQACKRHGAKLANNRRQVSLSWGSVQVFTGFVALVSLEFVAWQQPLLANACKWHAFARICTHLHATLSSRSTAATQICFGVFCSFDGCNPRFQKSSVGPTMCDCLRSAHSP
jgi:hypothetical protein